MAIVEIYECDECGVRSYEGPDDGLPDGWGENVDGMTFCKECLIRKPLDAHECDNDMCCYGRTAAPPGGMMSNSNTGHGHVHPRPDGVKARCGGPAICTVCAREAGRIEGRQSSRRERCYCPCHTHPGTYPPPCGYCGHDTRDGRMVGGIRDGWEPAGAQREGGE